MQLKQKIRELCWKIEELPASDLQTEISMMASELLSISEVVNRITLTEREISEIKLCQYYTQKLKHGTAGHNRMVLIASLAYANGFILIDDELRIPGNITVEDLPNRPPPNQSL